MFHMIEGEELLAFLRAKGTEHHPFQFAQEVLVRGACSC